MKTTINQGGTHSCQHVVQTGMMDNHPPWGSVVHECGAARDCDIAVIVVNRIALTRRSNAEAVQERRSSVEEAARRYGSGGVTSAELLVKLPYLTVRAP